MMLCAFVLSVSTLALVAFFVSATLSARANFAVHALTNVLLLQPTCAQSIVWDLPAGQAWPLTATPPEAGDIGLPVSVTLRGGAQAMVRFDPTFGWRIRFEPSEAFSCASNVGDKIVLQFSDGTRAASSSAYAYRSVDSAEDARPLLVLRGRVVIGEEAQFGGGTPGTADAPLLNEARIEARVRDRLTDQGLKVLEEKFDAGALIDSHACLDSPADELSGCLSAASSLTEGFLRLADNPDTRGFEVQLHVSGKNIGVRQMGSAQRRIAVTWWAQIIALPIVQTFAALLVLMSTLCGLWPIVKWLGSRRL